MSLLLTIQEAVKIAMKARDQRRVDALRLMVSAIKQQEISNRSEASRESLNNDEVLQVLQKMVKQRRDAIAEFQKANRPDLEAQETYEVGVIEGFLPQQMTPEQIDEAVSDAIKVTQPKTSSDMGLVMAYLKPKLQGKADMRLVSDSVKKYLQSL